MGLCMSSRVCRRLYCRAAMAFSEVGFFSLFLSSFLIPSKLCMAVCRSSNLVDCVSPVGLARPSTQVADSQNGDCHSNLSHTSGSTKRNQGHVGTTPVHFCLMLSTVCQQGGCGSAHVCAWTKDLYLCPLWFIIQTHITSHICIVAEQYACMHMGDAFRQKGHYGIQISRKKYPFLHNLSLKCAELVSCVHDGYTQHALIDPRHACGGRVRTRTRIPCSSRACSLALA